MKLKMKKMKKMKRKEIGQERRRREKGLRYLER